MNAIKLPKTHCPNGGKVCYDKRGALTALNAMRGEGVFYSNRKIRSKHNRIDSLNVYQCRFCSSWHVGTDKLAAERA